jgi:hypothetical protein
MCGAGALSGVKAARGDKPPANKAVSSTGEHEQMDRLRLLADPNPEDAVRYLGQQPDGQTALGSHSLVVQLLEHGWLPIGQPGSLARHLSRHPPPWCDDGIGADTFDNAYARSTLARDGPL